jgi:hypothetical protein
MWASFGLASPTSRSVGVDHVVLRWTRQTPVQGSNSLTGTSCPTSISCTAVGGLGKAADVAPVVETTKDGGANGQPRPAPRACRRSSPLPASSFLYQLVQRLLGLVRDHRRDALQGRRDSRPAPSTGSASPPGRPAPVQLVGPGAHLPARQPWPPCAVALFPGHAPDGAGLAPPPGALTLGLSAPPSGPSSVGRRNGRAHLSPGGPPS